MKAREQAAVVQPAEDYVRFEIQYALRPNSGICVIPVLVGDVCLSQLRHCPGRCKRSRRSKQRRCGQKRFEEDIAHLISRLETIAREEPNRPLPGQPRDHVRTGRHSSRRSRQSADGVAAAA